jgi:hypothetical protein
MTVLNKTMEKDLFDALMFAVDNFEQVAIPMAHEKGKVTSMDSANNRLKNQLKALFNLER